MSAFDTASDRELELLRELEQAVGKMWDNITYTSTSGVDWKTVYAVDGVAMAGVKSAHAAYVKFQDEQTHREH